MPPKRGKQGRWLFHPRETVRRRERLFFFDKLLLSTLHLIEWGKQKGDCKKEAGEGGGSIALSAKAMHNG